MKKILLLAASVAVLFSACDKEEEKSDYKDVTISLGANYVYDVFYSLENGEVAKVKRSDWDIAFSVPLQTAAIRINEGSGVEVFTAGSAADWDNLSINPTDPTFKKLWNDKSNWLNGAFNRNAITSNPFNYGWGTYDHTVTYNVLADSAYVIKLTDGSYKKFLVEKKDGHANANYLKWADLDGANPDSAIIAMGTYSLKNFVYFSIVNNEIVSYEPDSDTWDLLFTYYKERIGMGPGMFMDYPVMGVLTNQGCEVAEVSGIKPTEATSADSENGFVSDANAIGWEWKVTPQGSGQFTIPDTLGYFVKTPSDKEFQIYFTSFGGSTTGDVTFKQK
jgi:hypothetical protein